MSYILGNMYRPAEPEFVSEGWRRTYDLNSTMIPNVSSAMDNEEHFCKLILYKEIKDTRVRIWDVIILIPNLLFLLFIVIRFNRARLKLRATSSPIFLAFYGLVICNVIISVIRCVVSMTVNAAGTVGGKADKVLWVTVRFFLLSTEMSVVIFGLAFGHLDSRSSIRRVLLATSFIALAFTITQGTLELVLPDDTFRIPSRDFYVFGHGGMMFWFCSSLVFTMIYLFILILPWTRLRDRLALPTRKSFYAYAGTLAMLDLVQSIGAGFLSYTQNPVGLCIVDFTAAVYLTLFTPLVYHTFLSEFFGVSQPSIMFSYKAQVDDAMDEDTVSLPHQQSFSSLKTDSDYIYQVHTPSIYMPLYDSQALKASTSKYDASLYSLTSANEFKNSTTNSYSSHITLHKSTSGIKNITRRFSSEKSTPDLVHYALTSSDNLTAPQKSSPDLTYHKPTWKSDFTTRIKFGGTGSVTNLIFSSNTASNFIYKPKINNSNTNLFSETRKNSSESIITGFVPLSKETLSNAVSSDNKHPDLIANFDFKKSPQESSDTPLLENTLNFVLDNGTRQLDTEDIKNIQTEEATSKRQYDLLLKHSKKFDKDTELRLESASINSFDISNVSKKLLPKSTSFTTDDINIKYRCQSPRKESDGLGQYLLSLNSQKLEESKDKADVDFTSL